MGNQQTKSAQPVKNPILAKWKNTASTVRIVIRCQARVRGNLARKRFKRMKEENKFRRSIMSEIVNTEKGYLQNLEIMVKNYMDPMSEPNSCLNREEVELIFSRNIPIIMRLHADILKQLEAKWKSWRYLSTVGDVFNYVAPFLKCHSEYVNQYQRSITTLVAAQKRTAVKNFLKKVRDQGLMDLPSYLIMPVQRVPRYELLLREMLKYTPKSHPDFALVDKALELVKQAASVINEKNREAESQTKMIEIQQLYPNVEILVAHRRFVKQGEFEQVTRASQIFRNTRTVFLCNDAFIITFPRALNQDDVLIISLEKFAIFPCYTSDPSSKQFRQVEVHAREIMAYLNNPKTALVLESKENIMEWYELIKTTTINWIQSIMKPQRVHMILPMTGIHPILQACGPSGDLVYVRYYTGLSKCDDVTDASGNLPVHIAAMNGKVDILTFFLQRGVSANATNLAGQTPLHLSIRKKSSQCVLSCVEYGAYVNVPDGNGKTPLVHALEVKDEKIALYLCDHGARLISPQHIPQESRVYLEKAIRGCSDRYESLNILNNPRLQRPIEVNKILDIHVKNVGKTIQERRAKNAMTLCFLCGTTPFFLKVFCLKCQALCCQRCAVKKIAHPDQPRMFGQVCDSCFTILTKYRPSNTSFTGKKKMDNEQDEVRQSAFRIRSFE